MGISIKPFGSHKGKPVEAFTLSSETGAEVTFISYGAAMQDWRAPLKDGTTRQVALGFESFAPYPEHSPHLGAIAGRVANRIGGASFVLAGKTYTLPANEGSAMLHGGAEGLGVQVWEAEPDSANTTLRFTFVSPDGAMGFPGTARISATYRLTGNRLRLDFAASLDKPSPLSLVQHHYYNLGTGADVLDHRFQLESSAYTETDSALVPTGNILEVVPGSERDLRTAPRTLRRADGTPIDFDGNYVLDAGRDPGKPVATVVAPDGALTLKLWTDRPGLQFYDGVMTNIGPAGLGGRHYGRYAGFCLEDQAFPDAVHHPHFPSIWYGPERPYFHWCEIEIA